MNKIGLFVVMLVFLFSCKEDEDNSSIVGDWKIKSFEYKVTENNKVLTDQKWFDIGEMNFKNNGTGSIFLIRSVTGLPKDSQFEWAVDTTNLILVRFETGSTIQKYAPSYRGMFTYIVSTNRALVSNKFQEIEREILLQKKE